MHPRCDWTPDGQLGTFENRNISAGTWRLFVSDTYPIDAGTLVRWTIRIIPPTSSTPPSIASTPLSNSGSIVNRVVPVRIFDLDGIAAGTGAPRLWHKRSTDGAYTAVVADSMRNGNYFFSIPGRAAGTRVQYYIAAQDVNNNVSTLPRGGSGINPPGSTVPPTVYGYIVQNSLLAGSYNVGAGGNFPTLDSAFNKLSIDGIAGAITLNLTDTLYVATPHAMTATQQLLQSARENQKQSSVQPEHGIANADFSPALPSGITNGFVLEGPISGASATNRITIRPATGKAVRIIPIVLLTAKAGQENKLEGLETGADDYLTKPFDAKELLVRVKNLIETRRTLREKFNVGAVLKPGEIAVTSIDDQFLQKAMAVVEKKMGDEKFSVDEFAKEVGMSRSQLLRKLTALTNQSPSDFIRYMRLHRAKQLLEQNAGNVSEIAFQVGFNSVAYFTKCFREQFGTVPSDVAKSSLRV